MTVIRSINKNDFNKNYIHLISQLSETNTITQKMFTTFIDSLSNNHQIYVIEENDIIVASITLIIESKLIHQTKRVCHIEDLVVDQNYRKRGLSTKLMEHAKKIAKNNNCYKIILNCNQKLEEFYNKHNFFNSSIQMRFDI